MSGLSCAVPSTSGRCCELGAARLAGGRLQLLAAGQRQPRAGRVALVPLAAGLGRPNSLRNKYKCAAAKERMGCQAAVAAAAAAACDPAPTRTHCCPAAALLPQEPAAAGEGVL